MPQSAETGFRRLALLLAALAFAIGLCSGGAASAQSPVSITGTITDGAGEPVTGVAITVSDAAGFTQTTTTAPDGTWSVPLPGPGTYRVALDQSTLPDGVALRDPSRSQLSVTVFGTSKTVQFPIGEAPTASGGTLTRAAQLLVDGIVLGLIIALSGVGLSLIFGTTGLTNFAHGELMTFGALATLTFNQMLNLPFIISAVLALILSALFGWAQDAGLWRPLRRRGTGLIAMLVVSIGFGFVLRYLFLFFYGGSIQQLQYAGQAGLAIGPITITPKSLFATVVSIFALALTIGWLLKSRMGKASRAVSDNPALASASGINVEQVISRVWIIGATLAGLSGIVFSLNNGVSWQQGFQILLLVFASVVVGGLGSAYGALVGALIVGVLIQLSTLVVPPELKELGALLLLILLLLVRPQGILGRPERIG